MSVIIYDRPEEANEYLIDEVSQQIIVYLGFYGSARCDKISKFVGTDSKHAVTDRVTGPLGRSGAGLVRELEGGQTTLTDEEMPPSYALTDEGESFVYRHRSVLQAPTKLESIAHTVSELQRKIDHDLVRSDLESECDDLVYEVDQIHQRLSQLEDRIAEVE